MSGPAPEIEPVSLEAARQAGIELLLAEEAYCAAIVAAHECGNSTRTIAATLGISSHKVARILIHNPRFHLLTNGESSS